MPLLALLAAGPGAPAAEPGRTQWKLASFTWVKRVPAEAGAPRNSHPAALTEATLAGLLGPVRVADAGQTAPLFDKEELAGLGKAVCEAFSLAEPGEDLVLLSTSRRGGRFMEQPRGVTARLFVRDGALHLIVHDARLEFMDRYSADRTLPTFSYGSRTTPSAVVLTAPAATPSRSDWLAFGLTATPPAVTPAPAAPAAGVVAPTAQPAPQRSPEPPAGPKDAAFYEAQSQRLRALQRMKEEGLLTEAEYQQKREAILKTL